MRSLLQKLLYLFPTKDKLKLILLVTGMLIGALLEVIGIGMLPAFVSILAAPGKVLGIEWLKPIWIFFGIQDGEDLLIYGSVALMAIFFIKNLYFIGYYYIQNRFIHNRFSLIGSRLFQKYMGAPYIFYLGRNSSELLRNITQETMLLLKQIMIPLLQIAKNIILVTAIFLFLMMFEPLITVASIIVLGGSGAFFLKVLKKKMREFGKQAQKDRNAMIKDVNEGIGGIKDIRILNRENYFINRFKKSIKSYARSQAYNATTSQSTKPVLETVVVFGILLIALVLYLQGRGLEAIIPVLTLFAAATLRLMPAAMQTVTALNKLRYYIYSIDPIYDDIKVLSTEDRYNNPKNESSSLQFKNELKLKDAEYFYPSTKVPAVKTLNLTIKKGSAVGFVGPSGAGKTTVVDMILGLLKPQEGNIRIDGQSIFDNLSGWQKTIGYIPQSIFLIDDSLRRNIALGIPDEQIENEKLNTAIAAAQLEELMYQLEDGIETVIGERGVRLSGGQRQRIGIARALYHNPEVLIMDEATSALDNLTEKYIIEAVERFKGKRTILMIAHRLTTVENCDILYFMRNGEIIDKGTYEELIDRNREFQKMALVD